MPAFSLVPHFASPSPGAFLAALGPAARRAVTLVAGLVALSWLATAQAAPPEDRVLGDPDAPVTIIEYASLSCPHCATFHASRFPWLKENYIETGQVKFIFRDFPLNRPALMGSMLARCAPPERFYPLLDLLFRQQAKWAFSESPVQELAKIARIAGFGEKDFERCLSDTALSERIIESRKVGLDTYDVDSTPTLVVGDEVFGGIPSEEELAQLIQRAMP